MANPDNLTDEEYAECKVRAGLDPNAPIHRELVSMAVAELLARTMLDFRYHKEGHAPFAGKPGEEAAVKIAGACLYGMAQLTRYLERKLGPPDSKETP